MVISAAWSTVLCDTWCEQIWPYLWELRISDEIKTLIIQFCTDSDDGWNCHSLHQNILISWTCLLPHYTNALIPILHTPVQTDYFVHVLKCCFMHTDMDMEAKSHFMTKSQANFYGYGSMKSWDTIDCTILYSFYFWFIQFAFLSYGLYSLMHSWSESLSNKRRMIYNHRT